MYIGPFYLDTKELFLILASLLLGAALYFEWPLWVFEAQTLLTLTILILFIKGILKSINNDVFFFHALTTIVLSLFFPTFQIILFYVITFFLLRLFKVI